MSKPLKQLRQNTDAAIRGFDLPRLLKFITSPLMIVALSCSGTSTPKDPNSMLEQALSLIAEGRKSEAIAKFEEIVRETEKAAGTGPAVALAYLHLARMQASALRFVEADSNYFFAEQMIHHNRMSDTLLAMAFAEHGHVRLGFDDFEGSADLYKRAIEMYSRHYDPCYIRIQQVREWQAELFDIIGDFDSGAHFIREWLDCKSQPEIHSDSLALHMAADLADHYLKIGKFEAASQLVEKYSHISDSCSSEFIVQFAEFRRVRGTIALLSSEYEIAFRDIRAGLSLLDGRVDSLSSVFRTHVRALAECYIRTADTLTATATLRRFINLTALKYGPESSICRDATVLLNRWNQGVIAPQIDKTKN